VRRYGARRDCKQLERKTRTRPITSQELAEIGRNTGQPQHAGVPIEKIHQLVRRYPLLLNEIEHHARVQLAATGTHWQPVERGEAHRRRDRNPVSHCARRAAIAEMRDDDAAIGDFGRSMRQYRGNVFVGKPVKAVAPYALLIKRIGQRKCLINLRRSAVESGIEARDLRQFGLKVSAILIGARLYGSCKGATNASSSASNSGVTRAGRE
jgi:hypothetical protein